MDRKSWFYLAICVMGGLAISGGMLLDQITEFPIPGTWIVSSYSQVIAIGFICIIAGAILLLSSRLEVCSNKTIKTSILEAIVIIVLIISLAGTCGWLYGQYEKTLLVSSENIQKMNEQLKMLDQMETDNPFYSKKVIIRDDDVGDFGYVPSLQWLTNLAVEQDIKLTLAIIPTMLIDNPDMINFLNQLDKERFEFATHGYEHIRFDGVPYEEQLSLIQKGTNVISDNLHYSPYTFVPPHGSGDANTTRALRVLGYHAITDMYGYPSYVVDFASDFEYEINYHPPRHHSFEELRLSFDKFYVSSDEYYIVYLHDWTFLDEDQEIDKDKAHQFENAIEYIKSKNVQFMTIEEAYRWRVDADAIRTWMVDEGCYFVDFRECRYNHTVKFKSPSNWSANILLKDIITGKEIVFHEDEFEFDAIKGHWYEICKVQSTT
jgi:peptidoglycan/xylan/chitin deacetylase (PgdA/CDA1 family)